ncbi:MAG: hypothetical protein CW335_02370 [Clostridiales bacterium]|nr:hypothetical protein [Clostridiales bacterium]
MKKRREYEDDDGRQIVNMNVEGMPWYVPESSSSEGKQDEPIKLTREEKLSLYAGAFKAALLVIVLFIGVYFLVIFFLTKIW